MKTINCIKETQTLNNYSMIIDLMNLEAKADCACEFCINYYVHIKKIINNYNFFKNNVKYAINFLKNLIIYLIEKYYYKVSNVYFIYKVSRHTETFRFFTDFNKLKALFKFGEEPDRPYVRLLYYYTIMFIAYVYYVPITWFLLRMVTDPQNWLLYYPEQTNLCLLL